jgi:drug/metabolite transporter (DMT)-like permease
LDRLIGVLLVALSALCFGMNPIFARLAYADGANPETYLFIRYVIASALLVTIAAAKQLKYPKGRPLFLLIVMGAVGVGGSTFCYFTALTLAPVSLVVVITYIYPALVSLFSAIFFKERITSTQIAGLLLTFSGVLFVSAPFSGGQLPGIVLSVVTAVIYALYLVLGSAAIHKSGSLAVSTVTVVSSAPVYGILMALQGVKLPSGLTGWSATVASALLSTVFAVLCLFGGLKRIETANAAVIATFEVVVSIALSVIILKETVTWTKIMGAGLIIFVVIFLARSEYRLSRINWVKKEL